MKKTITLVSLVFLGISFMGACTSEPPKPAPSTPPSTPAVSPSAAPSVSPSTSPAGSPGASPAAGKTDAMVGTWPGDGGASLTIAKKGDKYSITIGGKTFEGTAKGDAIEFTRDGKPQTIKTATGDETGVKSLAGKKDCLVVTKGSEGFCKK